MLYQNLFTFLSNKAAVVTAPDKKGRAWRRGLMIFVTLVVLFVCVNTVLRAMRDGHSSQYADFTGFSRELLFDKINLFKANLSKEGSTIAKYPPFFSLVYAAFVPLPTWLGASIWVLLNLFLTFFVAITCSRLVWRLSGEQGSPPTAIWVIPLILLSGVVITNLSTAQVNIFILALIVFGLDKFSQHKDAGAGLLLGIATAIKITPGLFVAYFAYKRSWKTVFWSCIGVFICWGVILPLALGFSRYPVIMQSWIEYFLTFVTEGTMAEGIGGFRHTNQSMSAALYRFFTHTPAKGGFDNFYVNIMSLPYPAAEVILKGLKLAIFALLAILCRAPIKNRKDARIPLELSLVAVATLYISPISWINHYIFLFIPYTAAVYYLSKKAPESQEHQIMLKAMMLGTFLGWLGHPFTLAFSLPFIGSLILMIAMAKIIVKSWYENGVKST